jgi:hypothetical protein
LQKLCFLALCANLLLCFVARKSEGREFIVFCRAVSIFLISFLSCVGLVALLQNLALAWACVVLQMCRQMLGLNVFDDV